MKDCSSFLEGKEELGVENALFSVGLSALCSNGGEVDMAARRVSKPVVCDGETEDGWQDRGAGELSPDTVDRKVYIQAACVYGQANSRKRVTADKKRFPGYWLCEGFRRSCSHSQHQAGREARRREERRRESLHKRTWVPTAEWSSRSSSSSGWVGARIPDPRLKRLEGATRPAMRLSLGCGAGGEKAWQGRDAVGS